MTCPPLVGPWWRPLVPSEYADELAAPFALLGET